MTNTLVGDVYAKIIEEVVASSSNDFEESGVGSTTLQELQQEWQAKLSQRGVAQMPWDPKPAPPVVQQSPSAGSSATPAPANTLPATSTYPAYDANQANGAQGNPQVKTEPGTEGQLNGVANGNYPPNGVPTQGGLARAQQLVEQRYGNTMQQRSGLALPGQQAKPQGLQLPPQGLSSAQQQQLAAQQQAAAQRVAQPQPLQPQQQPSQPHIKVESDSAQLNHAPLDSNPVAPNPAYGQTDGADEALEEWRAMLAQRRAAAAALGGGAPYADRMVHERIMQLSDELQSGLMLPLADAPRTPRRVRPSAAAASGIPTSSSSSSRASAAGPVIAQLDGDADDDDSHANGRSAVDDEEDDENAINSDLDDPDDDGQGPMGDDDDDLGDSILCTYDKVQRVKNKWKCVLKDGVMSVNGKEWVFHKGMGEFEW